MTEDFDRTDEIIVTVPLDPHAHVASVVRPPRPLTLGRRRSDRWLAWSIVALIAAQALFTIYVAWRLDELRRLLEAH